MSAGLYGAKNRVLISSDKSGSLSVKMRLFVFSAGCMGKCQDQKLLNKENNKYTRLKCKDSAVPAKLEILCRTNEC